MELLREHWEKCMQDNNNLILQCKMQILMAEKILILCEEEIAKLPIPESKYPIGV